MTNLSDVIELIDTIRADHWEALALAANCGDELAVQVIHSVDAIPDCLCPGTAATLVETWAEWEAREMLAPDADLIVVEEYAEAGEWYVTRMDELRSAMVFHDDPGAAAIVHAAKAAQDHLFAGGRYDAPAVRQFVVLVHMAQLTNG